MWVEPHLAGYTRHSLGASTPRVGQFPTYVQMLPLLDVVIVMRIEKEASTKSKRTGTLFRFIIWFYILQVLHCSSPIETDLGRHLTQLNTIK